MTKEKGRKIITDDELREKKKMIQEEIKTSHVKYVSQD